MILLMASLGMVIVHNGLSRPEFSYVTVLNYLDFSTHFCPFDLPTEVPVVRPHTSIYPSGNRQLRQHFVRPIREIQSQTPFLLRYVCPTYFVSVMSRETNESMVVTNRL